MNIFWIIPTFVETDDLIMALESRDYSLMQANAAEA